MEAAVNTTAAYQVCEEITRHEAKNFSYGIRLLRPAERAALSAVYAQARRIDDIGDGDAEPEAKLVALARVRDDLARVRGELARLAATGDPSSCGDDPVLGNDPVLTALADASMRYPLPLEAFDELIDGCESDVRGTEVRTADELVSYCRQVAGSIGRLSLAVFGSSDPGRAPDLADDLGVALQLTNILRDVVEDRQMGRVYLPVEDAQRLGVPADLHAAPEEIARLVAFECARARSWFEQGMQLLPLLDRRSRACVGAMAGIYRQLLRRIEAEPIAVTRGRMSLPAWQKVLVAAGALAGWPR